MFSVSRLSIVLYLFCVFEVFNGTILFLPQQFFLAFTGAVGLIVYCIKGGYRSDLLYIAFIMLILNLINLKINYDISWINALNNSIRFLFPFSIVLYRPIIHVQRADWFTKNRLLLLSYTSVVLIAYNYFGYESYKNILFSLLVVHSISLFFKTKGPLHILSALFYSMPIFVRDVQRGLIGVFFILILTRFAHRSSKDLRLLVYALLSVVITYVGFQLSDLELDASLNNRLTNVYFLLEQMDLRFLLHGSGYWTNDLKESLGLGHFYISDLGIIGVIWTYGVFGVFAYYLIVKKYIGLTSKETHLKSNFILLFLLMHGLYTGYVVHNMCGYFLLSELEKSRTVVSRSSIS